MIEVNCMRRAVLLACLAALLVPVPAAHSQRARNVLDAAGLIDYSRPPNFKVGSWVKYKTTGSSVRGYKDDYAVTIIIAGEEVWWGEPCFWVETWLEEGGTKQTAASLITYEAFGDTLTKRHFSWFMRKTVEGVDAEGEPQQVIHRRDDGEFKRRRGSDQLPGVQVTFENLGRASTTVPIGTFEAERVMQTTHLVEQVTRGDSTIYYERTEKRTTWKDPKIPITGYVREDIDDIQQGKSWRIGESSKAGPLKVLEQAKGETVLVGFGDSGVTPEVVPARYRTATRNAAPNPARGRGGRKVGGRSS
jgi:hypothetical protein